MKIISVARDVQVNLVIEGAEPVTPPFLRKQIRPTAVTLTYAGHGYVRVGVKGRIIRADGTDGRGEASGYWAHVEGQMPSVTDVADTSRAPEWLRELAGRYAPPDFTAVS